MKILVKVLAVMACLVFAFFTVAFLYGLDGPRLFPSIYYAERNEALDQFAKVPGIANLSIIGCDDVTYEARSVVFQLAGRPGAIVQLQIVDDLTKQTEHLYLERLGPWYFRTEYYSAKDRSLGFGGSLDLGAGGDFAAALPFRLNNAQDIIAHYDDLAKLFALWPDFAHVGKVTHNDGKSFEYYCNRDGSSAPYPPAWLDRIKQYEQQDAVARN